MFQNRIEAGKKLASKLAQYENDAHALVLGLPRGGVVVAYEVAQALRLPLDVIVVRKIGAPDNPEFAIGAAAADGTIVWEEETLADYQLDAEELHRRAAKEIAVAQERLRIFRGDRMPLNLRDTTAIIVDDGIATGSTMRAAIATAKVAHARKIVVAVPVLPKDAIKKMKEAVDEVVYLRAPSLLFAVGASYINFSEVTHEDVRQLLEKSKKK